MAKEGDITEAQRRILFAVADETESWGRPWVRFTNAELAERADVSERWARQCRDDLLDRSLLQRREHGKSYKYGLGDPNQPSREEIRDLVDEQLEN